MAKVMVGCSYKPRRKATMRVTVEIPAGTEVSSYAELALEDVFKCDICGAIIPHRDEVTYINAWPMNIYAHFNCLPEWLQKKDSEG